MHAASVAGHAGLEGGGVGTRGKQIHVGGERGGRRELMHIADILRCLSVFSFIGERRSKTSAIKRFHQKLRERKDESALGLVFYNTLSRVDETLLLQFLGASLEIFL